MIASEPKMSTLTGRVFMTEQGMTTRNGDPFRVITIATHDDVVQVSDFYRSKPLPEDGMNIKMLVREQMVKADVDAPARLYRKNVSWQEV